MSSWFKSIFGEDDKRKEAPHSETPPNNEKTEDFSVFEMFPIDDIEYMFQDMDQQQGVVQSNSVTQPNGTVRTNVVTPSNGTVQANSATQPKGTVQPNGAIQPKGTVQPNGVVQPWGINRVFAPKILEVNTKLTVILVENTQEVAKEKDKLEQIVKSRVTTGNVCVINYGSLVRECKIVDAKEFDCSKLLFKEDIGENACLFDALIALEGVVEENYKKIEELKNKRIRIKDIDIIGIGRCIDNCSITSSEIAIESFSRAANHRNVSTKYFCISEESFVAAATIGFHSIGAIARNYM